MANYDDIGQPTVLGRGFVPFAYDAGLQNTLRSLVGTWGITQRALLYAVKDALDGSNPALGDALNEDNLRFFISQLDDGATMLLSVPSYPPSVPRFSETMDAPINPSASANGNTSINVSFLEAPDNTLAQADGNIHYEGYLDNVYIGSGSYAWTDGATWINGLFDGLTMTSGAHVLRLLYVTDGPYKTQGRLSSAANFSVA